jgi:hypothetical protein
MYRFVPTNLQLYKELKAGSVQGRDWRIVSSLAEKTENGMYRFMQGRQEQSGGNTTNPFNNHTDTTAPQNNDNVDNVDTIIAAFVIVLVTVCFFGLLWKCSMWYVVSIFCSNKQQTTKYI